MFDDIYVHERRFFQKHAALIQALEGQHIRAIFRYNLSWGMEAEDPDDEYETESWELSDKYAFVSDTSVAVLTCEDYTISLDESGDFSNGCPVDPLKWLKHFPTIRGEIKRVVPHYNPYTDRADGITFTLSDRSLTLFFHGKWGVNEPAPKYILRKQAREILRAMRETLTQTPGLPVLNDPRKAIERVPEMKHLSAMMGSNRLSWTYNPRPGNREIMDILGELTLIDGRIDPHPLLDVLYQYSEHYCAEIPNCFDCPLQTYCAKHKYPDR